MALKQIHDFTELLSNPANTYTVFERNQPSLPTKNFKIKISNIKNYFESGISMSMLKVNIGSIVSQSYITKYYNTTHYIGFSGTSSYSYIPVTTEYDPHIYYDTSFPLPYSTYRIITLYITAVTDNNKNVYSGKVSFILEKTTLFYLNDNNSFVRNNKNDDGIDETKWIISKLTKINEPSYDLNHFYIEKVIDGTKTYFKLKYEWTPTLPSGLNINIRTEIEYI